MPDNDHYVIIGNGPAGNHAAAILRQKDKDAKITIISDECVPYYYKPKLTDFIADEIAKEDLMVDSPNLYNRALKDIRIRCGQAVERIDPDSKLLFLQHMEKIKYSKLIIASGSRARVLPAMSGYANHLKFVTSYTDVMEVKEAIRKAKDFFILGGDLVGFKFLRMLNSMGKTVTILIYPDAFWPYHLTDGILVNEYLKTNMDSIYACGSCAQIYNPAINRYTTSIGWPNAVVQGEVAALNLLGF